MKKLLKDKKAITLIALIITIVIIVILAAISITLVLGDNGIIGKALFAKNNWKDSKENETKILDDIYSSILVAEDGTVTLNMNDLKSIINSQVREELKNVQLEKGDIPTGTVIAMWSNTAPHGYLACDGTEQDISKYPDLAELIKNTNNGSYGTSTEGKFKLPNLKGEFLRGAGTSSYGYNSPANAGVHQSATSIPYFFVHSDGKAYFKKSSNSPSNEDYIRCGDAGGISSNTNAYNVSEPSVNLNFSTRPTNTSVLYCIKY